MCSPQPRRLSKTSRKAGKAWGHSDAATQPRVRAGGQAEQELEVGDFGVLISNDGTDRDVIDLIEQNEMGADSDCDSCCSLDSIASGPSLQHQDPPLKPTLPSDLCCSCQSLYRKAKKMRNTPRDKGIDNGDHTQTSLMHSYNIHPHPCSRVCRSVGIGYRQVKWQRFR